jgi:hypothetical protein
VARSAQALTHSAPPDTWSEGVVLQHTLPVLYSHCLDTEVAVAKVMTAGGITAGDLQL